MAATSASPLTTLLKKATLNDPEEILKTSNTALKKSKSDQEALHAKIVALLKLERYEEAAEVVTQSSDDLKSSIPLECAYALYKAGHLEEAAELAARGQDRGAQHVEAQIRYRLEQPQRSREIYSAISRNHYPEEDFDLRVNTGAVDAQIQWLGIANLSNVRRPGREDLEAFETAYNAACGSIARGELQQAEMLLKRAKDLCMHTEVLSEQEKTEELLPIYVQQLYVLHMLGKTDEAEKVAPEITVASIPDASTQSIAQSNVLLGSAAPFNPFLAHKTFNSVPTPPASDKLFSFQTVPFTSNQKAINLQAMKFDGLTRPLSNGKTKGSPISADTLLASSFGAAALARNETGKAAIKKVLPELEKRPHDVGLLLTLAQMYVLTGNSAAAADLVDKFLKKLDNATTENEREVRFNPGLISLAVGLFQKEGRKSQIKQELAKAASYWRHKSKAPSSLNQAAGLRLLESSNDEDTNLARDIFEKLRNQDNNDAAAPAGLVASRALGDGEQTIPGEDRLTSIEDLTEDINVDALESQGIPRSSNAIAIAQLSGSRKRKAAEGAAPMPKRTRKSRLPKDYDPSKKPDPERWLPMKDRSSYRPPKGKKKKGKRDGGTQGGAVNEDLDIIAKSTAEVAGSGGGGGGGGGKKKKGKGKK